MKTHGVAGTCLGPQEASGVTEEEEAVSTSLGCSQTLLECGGLGEEGLSSSRAARALTAV